MTRGDDLIRLEHGSGGALSRELVEEVIYRRLRGPAYRELSDAAPLDGSADEVFTTDKEVVYPGAQTDESASENGEKRPSSQAEDGAPEACDQRAGQRKYRGRMLDRI